MLRRTGFAHPGGRDFFTTPANSAFDDWGLPVLDIAGLFVLEVAWTGGQLGWEDLDISTRVKAQIAGTGTPFHQAITGNNGHYATTKPFNLVFGNGSVDARRLIGATKLPAAGVPGKASNP